MKRMKRGTPDHPKTKRLARVLKVNQAWAVGILEALWHFAGKFSQQGDIGRHDDVDIAQAVFWPKDPSDLINALVETKWLERHETHRLIIHDWHEHADNAVRKYLERHALGFLTQSGQCLDTVHTSLDRGILPSPVPLPVPVPSPSPTPSVPPTPTVSPALPKESVCVNVMEQKAKFKADSKLEFVGSRLAKLFGRPECRITDYAEVSALATVCRRPDVKTELDAICGYHARLGDDRRYFPQSVCRLLEKWQETLDRARNHANNTPKTLAEKELARVCRDAMRI